MWNIVDSNWAWMEVRWGGMLNFHSKRVIRAACVNFVLSCMALEATLLASSLCSSQHDIPYSGKLEKTFRIFVDLTPFVKVFSKKMGGAHFGLLPIISGRWWIRESFLHEILYFTDSWKFSPSKVSRQRYTVDAEETAPLFRMLDKFSCCAIEVLL